MVRRAKIVSLDFYNFLLVLIMCLLLACATVPQADTESMIPGVIINKTNTVVDAVICNGDGKVIWNGKLKPLDEVKISLAPGEYVCVWRHRGKTHVNPFHLSFAADSFRISFAPEYRRMS